MTPPAGRRIMRTSARAAAPAGTGGPGRRDRTARLAHLLPAGPAMTEAEARAALRAFMGAGDIEP